MVISNRFFPARSVYIQQIQIPPEPPSSPRSPQISPAALAILCSGLIVVAVILYQWHQKRNSTSRTRRSGRNSALIDWHQAEFGCGPLATTPEVSTTESEDVSDPQPASPPIPELTPEQPDASASQTNADESSLPTSQTPNSPTLSDRYSAFIHQVITDTLNGKIRSKDYVYDQLLEHIQSGTGEVFERCLLNHMNIIQQQLQARTNDLKHAKAERQSRALHILQDAWQRYQQTQTTQEVCSDAVAQLIRADTCDHLSILLQILDPNQTYVFNRQQIERLAQELDHVQEPDADAATVAELHRLATGLKQGLLTYTDIEPHLVSWLYEYPQKYVGFGSRADTSSPWSHWAKHVNRPLLQSLFAIQARNQSAFLLAYQQSTLDLSAWVELIVVLRGVQNGLVAWFDKQPYSFKAGHNLAAATFLAFAIVWCELSNGFQQAQLLSESDRHRLSRACFQVTLQILRAFSQRDNFPLYGGVFASFSGESFRNTIAYLDQPLKAIEKTQEKARILTLLGYSQQWIGHRERAKSFYEEALDLARQASDQICEIANLNHLSRLSLSHRDFEKSVDYGQRALLLARQIGDLLGETNAIANLGYAEVRQTQQREHFAALDLESSIERLERGLKLAEKHTDLPSEVFCALGLGIAHLISNQISTAKDYLEKSLVVSTQIGNLELEGLSHGTIAEAYYQLNQFSSAVVHACLGMYLLEQKQAIERQQVANLISILQGRLGNETFHQILQQQRSQIVAKISTEGYEYLLGLLAN